MLLQIIKELLLKIVDSIDAGNSNLSEEDALSVIETLKQFTKKDVYYSKYMAYTYLGISRASFDKLVSEGKLPKGIKRSGFKEICWELKDLEKYKHANS